MTANSPLYDDPALVRFYDLENGWGEDTRFCARMAAQATSVLDLGCGTGLLLASLPGTIRLVGVDPAGAMLDVARSRPGGRHVSWIEDDARSLRLGETFDLVVMTGHAFQVFLTDPDQLAVLETVAAHLAPRGCFIFDSRNPAVREWQEWTPAASRRALTGPQPGCIEAWNDVAFDEITGIATYDTFYRRESDGKLWQARADIRFSGKSHIALLLAEAGLKADQWLGDWTGAPWTPDSPEIIPVGGLR
ncbi:MAG: class I SAM-dependent methyltransferase [Anderseniella sp.]|jgi:SAM-dependent methyltransferase|nr:class I SAM-dependent methyltransferase [Anderseniella sp.]